MKDIIIPLLIMVRRGIYLTLGGIDTLLGRKNKVTIFSYHSIAHDTWQFSIDKQVIIKQLTYLKKHYEIISLADVAAVIQGKKTITKPSVVLTFDDGYRDILELKPFFIKNALLPTLFVLSDTKNANYKELDTKRPFLEEKEILGLSQLGWTIGCHSATHSNLATLTQTQLDKEISDAKRTLETVLKKEVSYFAYPRGKYSENTLRALKKADYTLALSMDDGFINTKTNTLLVPRVGVDRSHTFHEFKVLFSPSVVRFRQIVKNILGRYL